MGPRKKAVWKTIASLSKSERNGNKFKFSDVSSVHSVIKGELEEHSRNMYVIFVRSKIRKWSGWLGLYNPNQEKFDV